MPIINFFINLLSNISKLFDKYGIIKTLTYSIILFLIATYAYILYSLITLDNRINQSVAKALSEQTINENNIHSNNMKVRMNNVPKIDSYMKDLLYEVNADRVAIIELHNGTNNMAGLPFLYGEMTYEQVRSGVEHIDEDYAKINLTRYRFPILLNEKLFFQGNIDDVAAVDDKLAHKISLNDAQYLVIYALYNSSNVVGYFCVSWVNTENPQLNSNDLSKIAITAQKLSTLLNVD